MNAATFRQGAAEAERGEHLNRAEHRLLANPATPEVDSLAEHIDHLATFGVPATVIAGMRSLLDRATRINRGELDAHTNVRELLDDCASAAHARQVHQGVTEVLTVRGLANELRPRLQTLLDRDDAIAYTHAHRAIRRLLSEHPRAVLLTASVRNELGPVKYRLLAELVEAA